MMNMSAMFMHLFSGNIQGEVLHCLILRRAFDPDMEVHALESGIRRCPSSKNVGEPFSRMVRVLDGKHSKMTTQNRTGVASRLAGQSGLLMLGNMFTLFAGLPLQIYLARTLGAEQFGAFGLFEAIAQTAAALSGFGLGFVLVRFIPQQIVLGQSRHVRQLLGGVYMLTLLAGMVAVVLLDAVGPQLMEWVPGLKAYASLMPFIGAMTLLGMLCGVSQQALRAFFDIRYMVLVSSILQLVLKIAITLLLIWWGWQLMGYLVAIVAAALLALAGMLWGIRGHIRRLGHTDEEILPETRSTWWSYSRTMYGNSLLGIAAAPAERFLLAGMINLVSIGILMGVRQLQALPQALLQIVVTVISPMLVAARARGDMDEVRLLHQISADWICRLGMPLLLFLLVFGDQVLSLYGPDFAEAGYWPLVIILAGQAVSLLIGPLGIMLNMLGHEKQLFRFNLISSGLFLLSLLMLVPSFGLLGVALGSFLSLLYLNLATLHAMKKRFSIGWYSCRHKRLLVPLAACFTLNGIADGLHLIEGGAALAITLVVTYALFFLVYLSGGLSEDDREIYSMFRNRVRPAQQR